MSRADMAENARRVEALIAPSIGTSVIDFEQRIRQLGLVMRVVIADGQNLGSRFDYRSNRVNVVVDSAVVTRIQSIG